MRIIGYTHDDAAGEAYDKAARAMGMPYPGGIHLDKVAEGGNDRAFSLPRPSVDGAPYDFSFSGLKTSVINLLHNARQKNETVCIPDLAASYRRAVVDCLVRGTMRAAEDTGARTLVIAGGVSANRLLRRQLERECQKRGLVFCRPELCYCGDNGAMVASQGYYEFLSGVRASAGLNACANMAVDTLE